MPSTDQSEAAVQVDSVGEAMLLTFQQEGPKFRPVIYIGPANNPNNASELYIGEWRNSLRKAHITGLKNYFDLYAKRYGFPHPEDPYRRSKPNADKPLPFNVMSFVDGEVRNTQTFDDEPVVH